MALKQKTSKGSATKGEGELRAGLKEFTRSRISDAALKLFRIEGFRSTTVEQIAELAGTTVPTFYRHFKSKDDLFEPLRDHLNTEVEQVLTKLDEVDVTNRAAVRSWLDSYMVMWTRMHRLCEAYWEAVYISEDNSRDVLPIAMNLAQVMQNVLRRVDPALRPQMELNLSFLIMSIDRFIGVVAVEDNPNKANMIMDQMAQFVWAILNNGTPLAVAAKKAK
ncbi:TetR/AcrR family transcriptional regulator [Sphingopyxis flava]|uniref:Transcriptional regulator, TetR family n=1 Tax=Sphingopyxis flava TaxID=1507287 RepID=A0A1T5GHP8_9SPHN|nr:TetR/AcrR family transcriptional regulator [Sphingopyxis flava]SKC07919.1 transcriptional regulator, TetR family [Sphingopyxis flava]